MSANKQEGLEAARRIVDAIAEMKGKRLGVAFQDEQAAKHVGFIIVNAGTVARALLAQSCAPTDRLIDALAECIVARQGLPNRDRAKFVLAEIEAQGWRLVPPTEEP